MKFLKPNYWDKNQISLLPILLFPLTILVKLLSHLKKIITKTQVCTVPVICVGNVYLGGTGKTPLCIELFKILKNLNISPAFIRKKYNNFRDEVDLLRNIGPVYEASTRISAVENAIQNKINVVILDDGFQDFSLKKNLSIVCFNEKQWIGNGLTIPSGPLRESLSALKRADCVVINGKKNIDIENKIYSENKSIKIFYVKYKAEHINELTDKKVIAFAGIGNPENFFDLLSEKKINIIEKIKFPDHYNYSEKELEKLVNKTKENDSVLVTTEKDYFRINQNYKKKIVFLKISLQIENENKFIEEIKKVI